MLDILQVSKLIDKRIDELEAVLFENEEEFESVHTFTPGLYSRETAMLAGRFVVSKVHKYKHQYVVLRGAAMVKINDDDWVLIVAPYAGETEAGTRRVLFILDDMSWMTFHPCDKTTVEEVEKEIIEPHINSVLGAELEDIRKFRSIKLK